MRLDEPDLFNGGHLLSHKAASKLPSEYGQYILHVFEEYRTGIEHIALVLGEVANKTDIYTRVHSECLTGDVFSSSRCDCGKQLKSAQSMIQDAGTGIIIYLRGQEGRGIGIGNKIRAYHLQDCGLDTVEANLALKLPIDSRSYDVAAEIIKQLEIGSVQLLTNNPEKVNALRSSHIEISKVLSLETVVTRDNAAYLLTKKEKLGHLLHL